jgi:hypothetical protein
VHKPVRRSRRCRERPRQDDSGGSRSSGGPSHHDRRSGKAAGQRPGRVFGTHRAMPTSSRNDSRTGSKTERSGLCVRPGQDVEPVFAEWRTRANIVSRSGLDGMRVADCQPSNEKSPAAALHVRGDDRTVTERSMVADAGDDERGSAPSLPRDAPPQVVAAEQVQPHHDERQERDEREERERERRLLLLLVLLPCPFRREEQRTPAPCRSSAPCRGRPRGLESCPRSAPVLCRGTFPLRLHAALG